MKYPIPTTTQEIVALKSQPTSDELVAAAIAGVIYIARDHGQSLEELMAELLADDALLDQRQRQRLSEVVATAWQNLI